MPENTVNKMNQFEILGDDAFDKGHYRDAAELYGRAINLFVNYPRLDRLARKQTDAMHHVFKEEDKKNEV